MNPHPRLQLFRSVPEVSPQVVSLNDFPDFVDAASKRQRIRADRTEVEAEIAAHERRLADERENDTALQDEALRIYEGDATKGHDETYAALERLRHRLEVLRRAEGIAVRVLGDVRDRRSIELAREAQPEHRLAVRNIARLIGELSAACDAEAEIRQRLSEAGAAGMAHLVPEMCFPPAMLSGWAGRGSAAATWIATARQQGFLAPHENLQEIEGGDR